MSIRKLLALAFLLFSCKPGAPVISQISGLYEGSLTTQTSTGFQKTSVSSLIPLTKGGSKKIDVTGASQVSLSLEVSDLTDSSLTLSSSLVLSAPTSLQFDPESGCYLTHGTFDVELCASEPEITFSINDGQGKSLLALVLYANQPAPAPSEIPQTFTLSQAIARAQKMSFQSKIEFEHVIQARASASAAYLHLVPQLTFSTIANNIEPGISSLVAAIGDLAPFLLPSRWIEAKEATQQSQAEQDSDRLMRLDMAAQVEGLFYTYNRDQRSLAVYKTFETRVAAILTQVIQAETAGRLGAGSGDAVQAAYNDLTHNDDVYGQILTEDRSALSQALGFFNPLTVEDVTIDQEQFPIENSQAVDFNTVNSEALSRSIEVDQFNDLIAEAKLNKKEEYFDWLDPVSNPVLGLGASLPSQLKIAQSEVDEIGTDLDQTKSEISQKVLNAVTDYEQALDNYQDAQSDIVLHEHRLNTILQELSAVTSISAFDLCSVISDDLGANLALEQARADYRVARAEIDRLLLQGYYLSF
jgi:outer membrane protein TolC